jgi:hypothetical protein
MLSVDSHKSEDNLRQVVDTLPTLVWCTGPDGSTEFSETNCSIRDREGLL